MTRGATDESGAGSGDGPAPLSRLRRSVMRRPPLAVLLTLCAALTVAATVALVVVATTAERAASPSAPASSGQAVGSGPGAPSLATVQAMLDRHGAHVLARDRAAFLADLDPSAPAAAYRSAQAAMFDNLAQVPLQSWTYRVSAPVTGEDVTAAAARYHAAVLVARVALGYQLRGADPAPTEHDVWLTFVRRSGRVRIASDSDLAGQGGASWRGPWDFGPVRVYRGASCLILAHQGLVTELAGLARVVDAAVPAVTQVWGSDWVRHVVVIVPNSEDELHAIVGGAAGSDLAADTVADQNDPRTGLRIVLAPVGLADLSEVGLRIVLRHEITHVATWALNSDALPTWLVEGFADYVGNLGSGQPVTVAASELRSEVRAGRIPAALPSSTDFTTGGARLPQSYEEAWLACRLIATSAGQDRLVRFYRQVAASTAVDPVDAALRSIMHQSRGQFTARWRQYLRTELG